MITRNVITSVQRIGSGVGGFTSGILSTHDHFGYAIDTLGDINGDGVIDLVVGCRWRKSNTVAVYFVLAF